MTRLNHMIRVPQIRCIDADGTQLGVKETKECIRLAQVRGLDLVEISPTAVPPVCRIMDYGKFKYDQHKKQRQSRKHQATTKVKEIKFHANVEDHDFETKVRHASEFLETGNRVKFSLFFRGRENAHQEMGFAVMKRAIERLQEFGNVEQTPKLAGRSILMFMTPKANKAIPRRTTENGEEDFSEPLETESE